MTGTLGWGVVGCGWVGRDLAAAAITACADARLVAMCDRDDARLSAAGRRFPSARLHRELADLLHDEAVDAIYVATPNDSHAAIVTAVAAAGRHVLCEKPMAISGAEATAMLTACRSAGVAYATAFDQRYHAAHRRLRELVRNGAIGEVTRARVHYACWLDAGWSPWTDEPADNWRIDPVRAGGGALVDLAPHSIDLLPYLLDDAWEHLVALEQHRVHGYLVSDGAVLAGRTEGGVLASIDVAYNCPEQLPRRRLELHGTTGMAEATDTMGQTAGGRLTIVDAGDGSRAVVPISPEENRSPFLAQVQAFSAHVLRGVPLAVDPAIEVAHVHLLEHATTEGMSTWR